jgi:hypothetical protein
MATVRQAVAQGPSWAILLQKSPQKSFIDQRAPTDLAQEGKA